MGVRPFRRLLRLAVVCAALAGCSRDAPSTLQDFLRCLSELSSISARISAATGYPRDALEVFGNQTHLQIYLVDAKLVAADAATREQAAAAVVAAAERALASQAGCASVELISIAIYHPGGLGRPVSEWHSEDVLDFRRGSDRRFSVQVP